MELRLTDEDREDLRRLVRATSTPAGIVRRARCILLLDEGLSYSAVCAELGAKDRFVSWWKKRYADGGILALADEQRAGRQDHRIPAAVEARVLHITINEKPPRPLTHWTASRLATRIGIGRTSVQKIWKRAGLKPHLVESYVASNDPEFETKATDVIGLYLNPPRNAIVFCVDEKTAIQALDRAQPVLPLDFGRVERHSFEYRRHGTVSLYAALDVGEGKVIGKTSPRTTSDDFIAFLDDLVKGRSGRKKIHIILDNHSAHKTEKVSEWLKKHRNVHFHFTPTYSSWLNQVEMWFARISKDMIRRGIFTSVHDLEKKILAYIKLYNKTCKPFRWTFTETRRRIRAINN